MAPKGRLLNFTEMQTFLDGAEQFGELVLRCWSYISRYVVERTKGFEGFCLVSDVPRSLRQLKLTAE